jgi:hypothetical protein
LPSLSCASPYVVGVTVREKVAACISEPDVAVTVTVDVVGVPPVVGFVVKELLLQPASRVVATTIDGSSSTIQCRRRRFLLTAKPSTTASEEPENNRPEFFEMAADATVVLTDTVELIEPVEDTVTGEKLHVAPVGNPEQVNLTAELVEKPFCGSNVTVVVPLLPAATVTAFGVTATRKSGAGAPVAGVMALAWLEAIEVLLESAASTT